MRRQYRFPFLAGLVSIGIVSCSLAIDTTLLRNTQEEAGSDAVQDGDAPFAETATDATVLDANIDSATDAPIDAPTDAPADIATDTLRDAGTFSCLGIDARLCDDLEGIFSSGDYVNQGVGPAGSAVLDTASSKSPTHSLLLTSGSGAIGEFRAINRDIAIPATVQEVLLSADIRIESTVEAGETIQLFLISFEDGLIKHQVNLRVQPVSNNPTWIALDQSTADAGPYTTTLQTLEGVAQGQWTHLEMAFNVNTGELRTNVNGTAYTRTFSLFTKRGVKASFRVSNFHATKAVNSKSVRFDNLLLITKP